MQSTILAYTQQQRALGISRSTHKASAVCPSPREAWAQSTPHPPVPSFVDTEICSESCLTGEKAGKEPGKEAGGRICYPNMLSYCFEMLLSHPNRNYLKSLKVVIESTVKSFVNGVYAAICFSFFPLFHHC